MKFRFGRLVRSQFLRLALLAVMSPAGVVGAAGTTNLLSNAEIDGRNLASNLCLAEPDQNLKLAGFAQIHRGRSYKQLSLTSEITLLPDGWQAAYTAKLDSGEVQRLIVTHGTNSPNRYWFGSAVIASNDIPGVHEISAATAETNSFAQSDFTLTDLGLEFFHWPGQKILKHEMRRSRACKVLESIHPDPAGAGYSRVVSWVDNETLGIVEALAYDANGRLLKDFSPKSFKKVNGNYRIESMLMENVQTDSRTRLEFD